MACGKGDDILYFRTSTTSRNLLFNLSTVYLETKKLFSEGKPSLSKVDDPFFSLCFYFYQIRNFSNRISFPGESFKTCFLVICFLLCKAFVVKCDFLCAFITVSY